MIEFSKYAISALTVSIWSVGSGLAAVPGPPAVPPPPRVHKQTAITTKPCVPQKLSASQIFELSSQSIAVIQSGDGLGSGFIVSQGAGFTYLVTNSHVVDGSRQVTVKWQDGTINKGKVIADYGASTSQKDLALIQINGTKSKPLLINTSKPKVGENVIAIGSPQGLEFSLSKGVVSQLRRGGDFIQIDAVINPGNSGGPLFDESGCVIGVVTFKTTNSDGIGFAVGYGPLKRFLNKPAFAEPALSLLANKYRGRN